MNSDMTLDDVAHDCWRRLQQGADDAAAPFRFPIVATQGLSHAGPPVPAARIVVLRGADPTRREVVFHTDQRSLKFAEIAAAARVTFVFYDAQARVQLRLVAQATAHIDDAIADAAWNAAAPSSRRAYRAKRGSGATIDAPFAWDTEKMGERTDQTNDNAGREQFAAIVCTVLSMDWLELCDPTHRRAIFQAAGDRFLGRWVVP